MIAWVSAAFAADCEPGADPCACEEERARTAARALEPLEATPIARESAAAWRATAAATCTWAGSIAATTGSVCLPTASCVRLLAESRLGTLSAIPPAARAADLRRLTGRLACVPSAGSTCAIDARRAEEERLVALIRVLAGLRLDPHDSERYWLGYRDSACLDESRDSGVDLAWAQAACEAVRTVRRADVLATLAEVADPAAVDPISRARLDHAAHELRSPPRPFRRWLAHAGDAPAARDALREAVEARVDGAVDPALLATTAWGTCSEPGSAECWIAVRAETRAARDAVAPPLDQQPQERTWRTRWCGRGAPDDAVACEAAIDLVVAEAFKPR